MVITPKVKAELSGGVNMRVYEVTGLAAGANNISAELLDLNRVTIAEFKPNVAITSAGATTVGAMMTTYSGVAVTITCLDAADAGTVIAYGY